SKSACALCMYVSECVCVCVGACGSLYVCALVCANVNEQKYVDECICIYVHVHISACV
ncbi:hypothetical protein HELRODRAFT_77800, partial [Helobdella robusta]|uniref:Uncharacterized protein n=1 Tax=Helobdella robusta TaxID=6412 RepID=T1G343_HELRO